ncbi:YkgJ family cysteine cluster protein [Paraburkholderia heleia]|uniref:YkgJ family cysteine cluster protein n=1 Tax=Paraburkholderia heleia TaxID=634127 RepID=UPI002AB72445|nr:YkgJ family cysteine cluster protein [Paraburkholderia heleia]
MSEACLDCGACCATFRVSFYWTEADTGMGGRTPEELVTQIGPLYVAMRGTDRMQPRCAALNGTIGEKVSCGVYENRSSACREFTAGDDRCNRARAKHCLDTLLVKEDAAWERLVHAPVFESPLMADRLPTHCYVGLKRDVSRFGRHCLCARPKVFDT